MKNSNLLKSISLGADPELFVFDKDAKRFVVSLDLLGGTKDSPRKLGVPGFFVQEDNVLVEFNIPPSTTKEKFITNISQGIELLGAALGNDRFMPVVQTSYKFPDEYLQDPRACMFGCDPDRNAWKGGSFNPQPEVPTDGLRSAGGHIHIGYKTDNDELDRSEVNRAIVKWMDLFLGLPSIIMDKDDERRKLYGKAGAYRDKEYGVEYRTLSSFWLKSKELVAWAYDQTMRAVDKVNQIQFIPEDDSETLISAINSGNSEMAISLVNKYDLVLA